MLTPAAIKEKYPKMFETTWGFSVGNGWLTLIDSLCAHLQFNTDKNNQPQIKVVQIKEKFGGLRFYVEGASAEQHGAIRFVEEYSYKVCEYCSTTNNVGRSTGWILTICKTCFDKEKENNERFKDRQWSITT